MGAERKPGWYGDGPAGVTQWWDGSTWKVPEPGDQKAAEKATNGRRSIGCISVLAVIAVAVILGTAISNGIASGNKYAVEGECMKLVAEWAGIDIADISSARVGQTPVALDYRGEYPGGEWACGGEIDVVNPYEVMVYPDGGVPEQIHSRQP